MFRLVEPSRSRAVSRLALLALMSAGVAGCSSDFTRTGEGPWTSKPQASAHGSAGSSEVTGSVRQQAAPSHKVESSALPAPAQQVTYGGGAGMGYQQPAQTAARSEHTGSVSAMPRPAQTPAPTWSWDGGTAIIVGSSDTLDTISKRHHVPTSAIRQANNMGPTALLQPGQRLVIPRATAAAAPQVSAPQTRVAGPAHTASAPLSNNSHVVVPGETIYSLARHYKLTPMAIAQANKLTLAQQLRVGQRVVIPGGGQRLAMPAPQQVQPAAPQKVAESPRTVAPKVEAAPQPAHQKVALAEPPASARVAAPAADPLPESAPTGSAGNSAVSFRWPVKGRISDPFGPKQSGGQNDGINITVPQGTPIKAAEDGVVAYAGSELKGYGNLVLVRHPNGYVTAYAHASELGVKKGETVKRGQVIGKAGATGNVANPQLHFEVRKGATPVDPMPFLTGG
jgi:murein DD-endopeptidase MepM/ murein hydrolase activator NlpD